MNLKKHPAVLRDQAVPGQCRFELLMIRRRQRAERQPVFADDPAHQRQSGFHGDRIHLDEKNVKQRAHFRVQRPRRREMRVHPAAK